MKSDSQIAVNSITGKIKAQIQISNLMTLLILQKTIGISFTYCNKLSNQMADKLSKKPIAFQNIAAFIINLISFLL